MLGWLDYLSASMLIVQCGNAAEDLVGQSFWPDFDPAGLCVPPCTKTTCHVNSLHLCQGRGARRACYDSCLCGLLMQIHSIPGC